MRRFLLLLVMGMCLPGCATASSDDRRAYILAHPHGWVEVTISDSKIPDVPPGEDAQDPWVRPYSCGVSVSLNEEPILREAAYPSGDAAPYSASTGFRFPAPVGDTELELSYRRCRVEEGVIVPIEMITTLVIDPGSGIS